MFERTLDAPEVSHIIVRECLGNLTVRGGSEPHIIVRVQNGEEDLDLEEQGEHISISAAADCTLVYPSAVRLTAERVLGNLRVEDVEGSMDLKLIRGNVAVQRVGPVVLDEALGNLTARQVTGDLQAVDVKGNACVRAVSRGLKLTNIAGNLMVEGVQGGLEAEKVRGNAKLGPPFSSESTYRLNTDGNLTLSMPPEASIRLALRVRGRVHPGLAGLDLEREDGEVRGTLGDGEAMVEASVRGNVFLRSTEETETLETSVGLEDLGAQIEWQVNEALADMATRLEASLGRVDADSIKTRVERATEQARRKAEHAAEQARLRAERAERRWQRAGGRRTRRKEPATDEERLRVLRMVEQGKLTPEQASELLAALED